ncbi:MAG TPA: CPBP family intramembrane glutamic endopeptidase [Trueperaceae bacterium]
MPLASLALFLAAHAAFVIAVNLGFRARVPVLDTLTANLAGLAVLVGGLLLGAFGLRPADVGLRARDVPAGAAFTLAYFALVQAGLLAYSLLTGAEVVDEWALAGAATAAYLLVSQLLGNALYEEVVFRGFLLPQLFLRFRRAGPALALTLAPAVSQAAFALAHAPNRLWVTGLPPGDLPGALLPLFAMGLFFALLYLLTDNLFAVVGVHALNNHPMLSLVADGARLEGPYALVALVAALGLAGAWRLWRGRAGRGRATPRLEPAA